MRAQVPLIKWLGAIAPLRPLLARTAAPISRTLFARAGSQLFMADRDPGHIADSAAESGAQTDQPPLLVALAFDTAKAPYFSALAAFRSRTAYANVESDHLVSWSNSSLRFLVDLPPLDMPKGSAKGVVRADPAAAAFGPHRRQDETAMNGSETEATSLVQRSAHDAPRAASGLDAPYQAENQSSENGAGSSNRRVHDVRSPPGHHRPDECTSAHMHTDFSRSKAVCRSLTFGRRVCRPWRSIIIAYRAHQRCKRP